MVGSRVVAAERIGSETVVPAEHPARAHRPAGPVVSDRFDTSRRGHPFVVVYHVASRAERLAGGDRLRFGEVCDPGAFGPTRVRRPGDVPSRLRSVDGILGLESRIGELHLALGEAEVLRGRREGGVSWNFHASGRAVQYTASRHRGEVPRERIRPVRRDGAQNADARRRHVGAVGPVRDSRTDEGTGRSGGDVRTTDGDGGTGGVGTEGAGDEVGEKVGQPSLSDAKLPIASDFQNSVGFVKVPDERAAAGAPVEKELPE